MSQRTRTKIFLEEHIIEQYKEGKSKVINRIAKTMRENVGVRGKLWEPKRKLEKKV